MPTTTTMRSAQLNRAYVQSKVIEASLEHLRVVLTDSDEVLRARLTPFTLGFAKYVLELSAASRRADTDASAAAPDSASPSS